MEEKRKSRESRENRESREGRKSGEARERREAIESREGRKSGEARESRKARERREAREGRKDREGRNNRENREDRTVPEKRSRNKKTPAGQYCPVQKRCGGCQYLQLEYGEQLVQKKKEVEKLLRPFCAVKGITGMREPFHYRNKVHAVFAHKRDGSIVSGTYEEGTHRVVPVEECLLEDQRADEIIRTIRSLLASFKIKIYNEDSGYGIFRHALIRTAHQTGEIMVVLVLGSPIFPSRNNFVRALLSAHPEITTIVQNINDKRTSMILGDRQNVLYGKGYIEDILCGCRFRISAKSFYQINSVQTEALYSKAMELACLTGRERVIDAYCGIGTIGIVAAGQAREVIGIELNPDAVRDAVRNARANDCENIRFYQNDAGVFMTQMALEGEKADVVFMDPPRTGSDEAFLSSLVRLGPSRVVYISCNPVTQARDLEYLTKQGYSAEEAWAFDLFPFTDHTETVCLLSNRKPDTKVRIDVDL